jgi:hypothetical protein
MEPPPKYGEAIRPLPILQYHSKQELTMKENRYFTLKIPVPDGRTVKNLLHWFIPNGGTLVIVALLLMTQSLWAKPFEALNAPGPSATTVNYQGRLADDAGVPLTGTYGMSFALYDAATGGTLIWGPENHTAVPVSDGLFSVGLGSQTSGGIPTTTWNGDRYLEITVDGETLAPRELIRSVPIAGMALTVPDGTIGSAQIADGAVTQDKAAGLLAAQSDDARIKWGNVVLTTDANGRGHISFSEPFPNRTYAVIANNGDAEAAKFTVQIDGMGTPGFEFNLYRLDGAVLSNRTVRIFYIAVGY